ncbi:alpha/beta hydrolase [Prosthecobacter sp.]|uniref:alpha/beta fold hydrolase n=1 Tax=Prosthecobacter sp. TaxID=1965333 RepID=UPI002AB9B055|nr:alpha/beta hydrolase [Prosthecobacter sp.]MDZ4406105.1 alpha/beta hydrolase [Prosthecobacter sp.]
MDAPVYLIPGLGADSRTYHGAWQDLPGCICTDWPEYHGESDIPAVARFMAEAWQIPDGAVLVGTSFGGVIACEIARIRSVRSLILVASGENSGEFKKTKNMRLLTRIVPLPLLQLLFRRLENLLERSVGRQPVPFTRAVLDSIRMFSVCQASFYRTMFPAIARWAGLAACTVRPVRIHGRRDSVIPMPSEVDLVLDGGHLIVMTHAQECVDFIRSGL